MTGVETDTRDSAFSGTRATEQELARRRSASGARPKPNVGRVWGIDDNISFHGESVAEFEASFHAAIEDYLAAPRDLGSVPVRPASGKLMLRIAPEVHAAALKAAARSGTSLNKWAEGALGKAARKPSARATVRSGR